MFKNLVNYIHIGFNYLYKTVRIVEIFKLKAVNTFTSPPGFFIANKRLKNISNEDYAKAYITIKLLFTIINP